MELPACGLYRTGRSLPGHEEAVPPGALVMFHNHSPEGAPIVLMPKDNQHNRWSFHDRGWLVRGPEAADFLARLVRVPREGYYVVHKHLHVPDGVLPERALVQVGYNRDAHPILFPARPVEGGIAFPTRGYRFEKLAVFEHLREAGFDLSPPAAPTEGEPPSEPPPTLH